MFPLFHTTHRPRRRQHQLFSNIYTIYSNLVILKGEFLILLTTTTTQSSESLVGLFHLCVHGPGHGIHIYWAGCMYVFKEEVVSIKWVWTDSNRSLPISISIDLISLSRVTVCSWRQTSSSSLSTSPFVYSPFKLGNENPPYSKSQTQNTHSSHRSCWNPSWICIHIWFYINSKYKIILLSL